MQLVYQEKTKYTLHEYKCFFKIGISHVVLITGVMETLWHKRKFFLVSERSKMNLTFHQLNIVYVQIFVGHNFHCFHGNLSSTKIKSSNFLKTITIHMELKDG